MEPWRWRTANGRFAEALEEIEKAVQESHGIPPVVAAKAYIQAETGDLVQAQASLRQFDAAGRTYIPAIDFAAIYSGLRDRKRTLTWLDKALDEKSTQLFLLPSDSRFRWLLGDSRFQAVLDRMELPPHVR